MRPALSASFESPIDGSLPKREWRWPTVIFAAVPATLLAFPAALAILFGGLFSLTLKPMAFAMFFGGLLGWAGMISLWSAARSSGVVKKWTARGLVAGIVSVLFFIGMAISGDDTAGRLGWYTPLLTVGPLLFGVAYLARYQRRTGKLTAGGSPHIPPPPDARHFGQLVTRPFNEARMRRILWALLIIPAMIELLSVPPLLGRTLDSGTLLLIVAAFPPFLGIAVTAVWCFCRSRKLRWLAGVALVTPVVLPFLLHEVANLFGHEPTTRVCTYIAIAIPALFLLIRPKWIAACLPRFAMKSWKFNLAWICLQVVMILIGLILGVVLFASRESATPAAFTAFMFYCGALIVVSVFTLLMAYLGLRAPQRRYTKLRVTQIALSLVMLLLMGVPAVIFAWFLFSLAGIG